jgi:hypothetical protein
MASLAPVSSWTLVLIGTRLLVICIRLSLRWRKHQNRSLDALCELEQLLVSRYSSRTTDPSVMKSRNAPGWLGGGVVVPEHDSSRPVVYGCSTMTCANRLHALAQFDISTSLAPPDAPSIHDLGMRVSALCRDIRNPGFRDPGAMPIIAYIQQSCAPFPCDVTCLPTPLSRPSELAGAITRIHA